MDKIFIHKTDKCDTRTLKDNEVLNSKDVESDTKKHIGAVQKTVKGVCDKAIKQAKDHDGTKLGSNLEDFTKALSQKDKKIKDSDWYQMHVTTERHHLLSNVPDDVNIIDLIEMICDCVCAGKARTGDVYPMKLEPEVMQKIIDNTVELLKNNIEVRD